MNEVCENFKDRINIISKLERQEFVQLAFLFLNQLKNQVALVDDCFINNKIQTMNSYLVNSSQGRTDQIKEQLLLDNIYIDDLLIGHKQDWETATQFINLLSRNSINFVTRQSVSLCT